MNDAFDDNTRIWDKRIGVDSEQPDAHRLRLQKNALALVINGDFGRRVLNQLSELPMAKLTVLAMTDDDVAYLRSIRNQLTQRSHPPLISIVDQPFLPQEISMMLARYRMVVMATGRPFPDVAADLNTVCVSNGIPWLQAHLWGVRLSIGPTVLPGTTACYECYRRRLAANSVQHDVDEGLNQFLIRDKAFAFSGQLGAINTLSAAYVTAEVKRFLSAQYRPTTLSQEMTIIPLHQGASPVHHFVTPLEWCPVCWEKQCQRATAVQETVRHTLKSVVARFARPSPVAMPGLEVPHAIR
jgi:bacteriocin biosynthesis cyclodehydratase domain-containing protein